jgi:uncharacterized protein YjdB
MLRRLALGAVVIVAAGCGDSVSPMGSALPAGGSSQVARVVITPDALLIPIGDTVRLRASTRDAAGNELSGRVVSWSTDSPGTATVSATGLVTGLALGSTVRITALSEGASSVALVTTTS